MVLLQSPESHKGPRGGRQGKNGGTSQTVSQCSTSTCSLQLPPAPDFASRLCETQQLNARRTLNLVSDTPWDQTLVPRAQFRLSTARSARRISSHKTPFETQGALGRHPLSRPLAPSESLILGCSHPVSLLNQWWGLSGWPRGSVGLRGLLCPAMGVTGGLNTTPVTGLF